MGPLVLVGLLAVGLFLVWRFLGPGRQRGSGSPEAHLVRLVHGDRGTADRLIRGEQARTPGLSRSEAAARAIRRLERDRGR